LSTDQTPEKEKTDQVAALIESLLALGVEDDGIE